MSTIASGSSKGNTNDLSARVLEALDGWPAHESLSKVIACFPHLKIYLAGGVVRDIILGRSANPKDFDFFIDGAFPEPALEMLAADGVIAVGPFGSPRWFPRAMSDIYCDVISTRHFVNGLSPCEDITDALNQFDFTGNAVACDLRDGRVYDPQNGRRDLEKKVMRAVRFDYPDEPIVPGHPLSRPTVLWFRILHYARTLDLEIEPVTLQWIENHRAFYTRREQFAATFFQPHPEAFARLGE